ncbi:MAG: hypothetical protein ACKV2U_10465 [Bryobacteraceae bacterium]
MIKQGVKPITAIKFSPDNQTLAAIWDSWLGIWVLSTHAEPITTKVSPEDGSYSAVQPVTFHPNGKQIAVTGKDGGSPCWAAKQRKSNPPATAATHG